MIRFDSSSLTRGVLPRALVVAAAAGAGCQSEPAGGPGSGFPPELVDWVPYGEGPVFAETGGDTWDRETRERRVVLREGDAWKLWYTGYNTERAEAMFLGYATSPDGVVWTRHPGNPVFDGTWTGDVDVLKHEGV